MLSIECSAAVALSLPINYGICLAFDGVLLYGIYSDI